MLLCKEQRLLIYCFYKNVKKLSYVLNLNYVFWVFLWRCFFNVTIHSKINMNKWGIGAGRDADTGEINFHLEGFSIV